ncbi:tRNA-dependent cyclodipeptide synthase [Streptomyces noursei]|uniref:tRNA-dependent cyclodipeptide synthase n=1 Tax=Streptomyces TaxID=1883 RepID=UPI0035DF741C
MDTSMGAGGGGARDFGADARAGTVAGRRVPPGFTIEPFTDRCREIWARGEHVLIGVSPGNGYFSEQRLTGLLRWASEAFAEVDPIVPDVALVHTYRALGHPEERARSYAQRDTRRLCRRIARAWTASGVPEHRHRIRTLTEFTGDPTYRALLGRVERAAERQPSVREVFLRASGKALASHLKGATPTPEQLAEGMRYLIAEMPLCMDTPAILRVPSSVHVYHQVIPTVPLVFDELFTTPLQAYAVVRPVLPGPPPSAPSRRSGQLPPVGPLTGVVTGP